MAIDPEFGALLQSLGDQEAQIKWAEDLGLISSDAAAMVRQVGGLGVEPEDSLYDITDIADLSLYEFHRLYQQLAIYGHLLDLEQTVCNQKPIFADDDWKLAILMDKIEKG